MVTLDFERRLHAQGVRLVAGVDEAGRGPLAGPVVAAAVIFSDEPQIAGVDDSKKLHAKRREELFEMIMNRAAAVGVGLVPAPTIDAMNIYRATMEAMRQAVSNLAVEPGHLLIDGPRYHDPSIPFTPIVDGDARCFSIAAASIIAKVTRDRLMLEFDRLYPEYGFAKHKGYGTPDHLSAIRKFGPCEIHRRSFRMPAREEASCG